MPEALSGPSFEFQPGKIYLHRSESETEVMLNIFASLRLMFNVASHCRFSGDNVDDESDASWKCFSHSAFDDVRGICLRHQLSARILAISPGWLLYPRRGTAYILGLQCALKH